MTSAGELVRVSGITRSYGRLTAIRDVSFGIRAGEILGLIGPNGAGKTTLFECLAGVQPADRGSVMFGDIDAPPSARSSLLFYVPDAIAPWPTQTVAWAIEFALGFFGGRCELRDDLVRDLHLEPLMRVRIGALSKGQRKRTMLALGLLMPQPIVVIDEPFEGLDLRQSREVEATLRKHAQQGRTLFLSIHQIADAGRICDRFVLLSSGNVVAVGTLAELTALAAGRSGPAPHRDFEEIFLALT
jgi:ABC-type multidrug transport system ATPase subunit